MRANSLIDFDFGEPRLTELSQQTYFPWLLSNAVHHLPGTDCDEDELGGKLLACAEEYTIKSIGGYKIGFIGLAGTYVPRCNLYFHLFPDLTRIYAEETGRQIVNACRRRRSFPLLL
jgi:2',3'-cyclic-nucleotide 2'-phosphodiesterase (5'-nucleotidase family)